jgi:hypothetical protein
MGFTCERKFAGGCAINRKTRSHLAALEDVNHRNRAVLRKDTERTGKIGHTVKISIGHVVNRSQRFSVST